jgi:hypothetical protein
VEHEAPMMGIFFANPWGLLALAALPAIVAIHFLQEQSRRVRSSTLFLLERAAALPAGGIRFEKFRNSLPFWMQILAALALAWLLADPRWVRNDSRQTVAVVLDSSASMQAARGPTLDLLAGRLASWEAVAARTDWHLLETGPGRPPLYAGRSLADLLAAAATWRPSLGTHDPAAALAVAAALVPGDAGAVVLVTDRPVSVPGGVAVLSAGAAFDNVGFSGGSVRRVGDRFTWRTLVTNHGQTPQTRAITARIVTAATGAEPGPGGDAVLPPQTVLLAPGQSRTLEGVWPEGCGRLVLALAPDRFPLDDTLPLVRPVPRIVKLAVSVGGPAADLVAKMAEAAAGVEIVSDPATADLVIGRFDPAPSRDTIALMVGADEPAMDGSAGKPAGDAAQSAPAKPPVYDPAWVAAEDHPLTRDLGWGGLLSGPAGNLGLTAADEPLLWKGGRPLACVRANVLPGGRRVETLVLNFDLAASTAARSPAVVVLVQRFVERVRGRNARPWADNFDTAQAIDLPPGLTAGPQGRATIAFTDLAGKPAPTTAPFRGRAPAGPGFFTVSSAPAAGTADADTATPVAILSGAAQFADSRESDFRTAAPLDTLESLRFEQAKKQSIEDPWTPLWLGLAIGGLLVAWGWRRRT